MTTKTPRRIYTVDEWLAMKYPGDDSNWAFAQVPYKMPLYAMREITQVQVNSIHMFSDEGWKEVHKVCKGCHKDDSPDDLASGFCAFSLVWFEDNEFHIDPNSPDERRGNIEIFYNDYTGEYVYWRGCLYTALINRWSEYLLGD